MTRQKVLYLGLDPSRFVTTKEITHYPIITIKTALCTPLFSEKAKECDLILLTSRTAVRLFFERAHLSKREAAQKLYFAVGSATAGLLPHAVAPSLECGEGVIQLLEQWTSIIKKRKIFYPHSSAARPLIANFLRDKGFSFYEEILYSPEVTEVALPSLEEFDEIVFTSPSTVAAFFSKNPLLSHYHQLTSIGEITKQAVMAWSKLKR